jgi:uncharacterized repeat protein (TIGR01451 family)
VKKAILCCIVALGLVLSLPAPVMASGIQLAKNTDPLTPNIYYLGDTIHYVLTVTNPIGNTATNYVDLVEDILPDLPFGSNVKTLATNLTQAPGASNTYSLNYTVNASDLQWIVVNGTGRWRVVNTLHVKGSDSAGDTIDATTSRNSIILRPELSIEKTVDCNGDGVFHDEETWYGPDNATWKVVVTNTGFDPVYNITVTDTNGHNFGSAFDLAVGANKTFTYTTVITATTKNTATAVGKDEIGGTVGPVSDSATNNITKPNTITTIAANATTVPINGKVSLTVTEQNTGGDNLTKPRVEVRQNGTLIATLNSTSPHFSGDAAPLGVLNVGETWKWTDILSNPITATTTFEALGFGTDSQGHEVSYAAGYWGERALVTVTTPPPPVGWETYPINKLRVLLPWIGLLAAIIVAAGLLVLRRRRT